MPEPGQEARNGNRAASYATFLAHLPSTAASMLVKGRQRSGKDVDLQRHPNTAEAEMHHQDVEPPRLFNDRVTRERPGEIKGETTEKMEATRPRDRNTTVPCHNKK